MANTKSKSRKKILVLSFIGLGVVALGAFSFLRRPEAMITIQTEKVTRRNLTELVVATGRIQPVVFVKISPEVSGEITELPVKEGQQVQKGDLLLKIKPDTYEALRNIAEANYKSAQSQNILSKAQLDKAQLEYKRNKELFDSKLISDSQFLDAKTGFDVASASYQATKHQSDNAKAALERAAEDLSKTTICSPLSGTISKLNSQLGERVVGTATYQGTEVMTIADLNDMEARVDIGEIDVVLIAIGQKTRLEVDSFRDRKFTGIVSDIGNTAKSSNTGSQTESTKFEVRIRIQEKEAFRPGMSVTAEVETRSRTNVLTVPIQSVTTRMPKEKDAKGLAAAKKSSEGKPASGNTSTGSVASAASTNTIKQAKGADTNAASTGTNTTASATNAASGKKLNEAPKPIEVVFLVENNTAKMTPVKRGISDDTYVEITEGLTENQEVVSGGYKAINRELEEGKKVKVDNTKKSGSEGKDGEKTPEEKK